VLILLLKSEGYEWDSKMLVSSADKEGTVLSHAYLGTSFIKMRRSKGHKTKPWGTPYLTLAQADIVILSSLLYNIVFWYLLVRICKVYNTHEFCYRNKFR
jgi:hypothetical protein